LAGSSCTVCALSCGEMQAIKRSTAVIGRVRMGGAGLILIATPSEARPVLTFLG
jgi:MinD superfamily P-loop ATPase